MVNVKDKKCIYENCNKIPTFNIITEKKPKYCSEHKKENMVNVRTKKCIYENCNKIPNFNLINEKIPKYCAEHKKEKMVDIKNKKCIEKNCNKQPNYNLINEKIRKYCKEHKTENMVDIKNKKCIDCNLNYMYYGNLCFDCFSFKFPNHERIKKIRQKEIYLSKNIKYDFPELDLHLNKQIPCQKESKARPDIYINLFHYILVIEIDENQHQEYSCENKRMMEIFQASGNKPIIFIRINPDGKNKMFSFNKLG